VSTRHLKGTRQVKGTRHLKGSFGPSPGASTLLYSPLSLFFSCRLSSSLFLRLCLCPSLSPSPCLCVCVTGCRTVCSTLCPSRSLSLKQSFALFLFHLPYFSFSLAPLLFLSCVRARALSLSLACVCAISLFCSHALRYFLSFSLSLFLSLFVSFLFVCRIVLALSSGDMSSARHSLSLARACCVGPGMMLMAGAVGSERLDCRASWRCLSSTLVRERERVMQARQKVKCLGSTLQAMS